MYYLPNEEAWTEDFNWRMASGIGKARVLPYDSDVGDCEVQVTVESEEQLLMMKIRHPRAHITDYFSFYGVPNEGDE